VAQDALHGEGVDAGVEQQAGRRVAQIVKPQVPRDRARPHLHSARTAPAQLGIVVLLHVRATFLLAASAHVLVVRDKPCPGHRTPQNLLELGLLVEHLSIRATFAAHDRMHHCGASATTSVAASPAMATH
jgi:hypothetical protein